MAIDFMAYARGQRTALDNMLQEERLLRERSEREREWEKQLLDRQAASYLSTSTTNQQLAADAGISPIDYMIQQREQTLADPNFQRMPPALQQAIVEQMRGQAVLMAQNAYNQGNMADANRLVSAYGNLPLASQFQTAGLSGNVAQIVQAMNEQFGTNAVLSEDGQTVTVNGTTMPAAEFARQAWASGSGAGGLTALAAWQEAQRLEQARQEEYAQALRLAGIDPSAVAGPTAGIDPSAVAGPTAGIDPSAVAGPTAGIDPASVGLGAAGVAPAAPGAAPASVADVARAAAEQEILGARAQQDAVMASPGAWLQDALALGQSVGLAPKGGRVGGGNPLAGVSDWLANLNLEGRHAISGAPADPAVTAAYRDAPLDPLRYPRDAAAWVASRAGETVNRYGHAVDNAVADAVRALYERVVPDYRRNPEAARERWAQSQAGGLAEASGEVAALRERLSQNLIQQSSPTVNATTKARLRREAAQLRQRIKESQDGS
jgi:hypothetical protein